MPIFTRAFDFLTWLLPVTNNFPGARRITFTERLLSAAFEIDQRIESANHHRGVERTTCLALASELCGLRSLSPYHIRSHDQFEFGGSF